MHRRLPLVLTLVAWLFATGTQWDLLQTYAWARMFADNARTLPLGAALARTFSPEGRCHLCCAVTRAKQQQQEDANAIPGGRADGRLLLVFLPAPAVVVAAPDFAPWAHRDPAPHGIGRAAPPLPPPRALA